MEELTREQFSLAWPLYRGFPILPASIHALLDGPQYGRVFVDRREQPASAFIWWDAIYLAGEANNAAFNQSLLSFLRAEVFHQKEHLLLYIDHPAWDLALQVLLKEYGLSHVTRTGFSFDPALYRKLQTGWRDRIPEG